MKDKSVHDLFRINRLVFEARIHRNLTRKQVAGKIMEAFPYYAEGDSEKKIRSLSQMIYNIECGKVSPPINFLTCLMKIYKLPKKKIISAMLDDRRDQLEASL